MSSGKYLLFTDGAARGNPGPAGAGALIRGANGRQVFEISDYLGETTNNVAEYQALLRGLRKVVSLGADEVEIRADSELIVRQIRGEYRVRHPNLKPLHEEALGLLKQISKYTINHIDREENFEADRLANQAIDDRFTGGL